MYIKDGTKIRLTSPPLIIKCTCSLFMNPNTPAAISAPKIIRRQAKNCRGVLLFFIISFWLLIYKIVCVIVSKALSHIQCNTIYLWNPGHFNLPRQEDTETHGQPRNNRRSRQSSSTLLHREGCTQLRRDVMDRLVLCIASHRKTNNTLYNTGLYWPK